MSYRYQIVVDMAEDGYIARLESEDTDHTTPLRGFGESPLQAVRALCETLREWPIRGSRSWLNTPAVTSLARQFVPGFDPDKRGDPC